MIEVISPDRMVHAREAGALVAKILQEMKARTQVGTNLLEIDAWTKQMIVDAGAVSCYVDYAPSFGDGPFGFHICTSVNDAVLHGKPHDYVLQPGDLLSLDLALQLGGVVADSAISFLVGEHPDADVQAESLRLIEASEKALAAGIEAAGVNVKTGNVSAAIGTVLKGYGYTVNTQFGGHGVGTTMHQEPHVSNDGRPGRGYRLRAGLLVAIEPWVMTDTDKLVMDPDGWTLRSATGCRTAHSEHTVAITGDGVEIMTLPKA